MPSAFDQLYVQNAGRCRIVAHEIKARLGPGARLMDLVKPEPGAGWRYPGEVHHVVVAYKGKLYDVAGAHEPEALLELWSAKLGVKLVLEKHSAARANDQRIRRR